ncbi:MAG: TMEM175 family protein [Caldilineaceae bacterium]
MKTTKPITGPGNERLNAFSDGVFAIAITLLAFELHTDTATGAAGLWAVLPELATQYLGYILGFAVLGIYWVGHHNLFLHIRHHDRVLLWLNNLFLMIIATMPAVARLLTHDTNDLLAIVFYTGTLVAAGVALELIWWYASTHRRLVEPNIDPQLVLYIHRRILLAPTLYLLTMTIAVYSRFTAVAMIVMIVLLYIVHNPLDDFFYGHLQGKKRREAMNQ